MNRASIQDIRKQLITTTGIARNSFPIIPGNARIGKNAATLVRMANARGTATSLAPCTAASGNAMPCCICSKIFSPAIMASSTTIPSAIIKANIEIILMDTSAAGINSKAPKNAVGIPIVTQKARRYSRNRLSNTRTSTRPMAAFFINRPTRWLYVSPSSSVTISSTPGGNRVLISSICRYAASVTVKGVWFSLR